MAPVDLTAYTYIVTSALPGGISIGMTSDAHKYVVTETGVQNQHVWHFKRLNNGHFTISTAWNGTTVQNGRVCGVGSGMSKTEWIIRRHTVHQYYAHTIEEAGSHPPRYWAIVPNRLSPGTQIAVLPKPPGGPDLYPGALWVFTSTQESK
ncbi:hypothetical protein BD779DRAFT_802688 [Infundibulicybe gibba]|nr:hypothetical protein BD779DRAFT_802688 [Infundibulicybe gibba]